MRIAISARRCALSTVASVLLLAAAIGVLGSVADAATNFVSNGTFEGSGSGSLSGWGGSSGALSLTTGNGGGHAALLTANSGAASMYAYTVSKPVTGAAAGSVYSLSGDVQSALAGQSVCLVVKELVAGTTTSVGSAQNCVTATAAWQSVAAVSYTVKTSGDSLTVNVQEKPAVSGANFALDNIALVAGTAVDSTPPSVPQGVGAVANGPTSVTVSWSASSDASGIANYEVYRGGTLLTTVSGSATSFTDTSVLAGTQYSYTVDAIDGSPAKNKSAQSSPPATVTTPAVDSTPPSVPQGVGAVANGPTSVTVSWSASSDASGIANYEVYRGGTLLTTVSGSATSFTDTSVLAGTQYSYTVDAIDGSPAKNKSAQSSPPATVTTPAVDSTPPSVPQGVGAVANGPTSVTVSWSASSDASGIANYEVYRGGTLLTTVSGSATSFTDTSVLAGTQYSYTVDAIDGSPAKNKSAQSSPPATVTTPAVDSTPPSVPQGVGAVANGPTSVTVSWSASSDASGIANYEVYRGGTLLTTVSGSATSFTDTSVLAGTQYSYTVDAIDGSPAKNKSAQSSPPATVTTPAVDSTPPSVPQGVGAVANGPTSVTVSWSASSDASGIANYEVYRGGTLLTTVSGSATSFTDTSVLAGTRTPTRSMRSMGVLPKTSQPNRHHQQPSPRRRIRADRRSRSS